MRNMKKSWSSFSSGSTEKTISDSGKPKGRRIIYVKSGLLKCGMIDDSGKEQILQFATEDWWISDYTAFYKHQPARLAVDCIDDSEVYSITYTQMNEVCRRIPKAEHFSG